MPEYLVKAVDKNALPGLAADVVRDLYAKRAEFPDRLGWPLEPELVLLRQLPEDRQAQLAEQMLRVRAGIAPHQTRLAHAKADLATKRTALAGAVVDLLHETNQQFKARKKLAGWGKWMLLGTTLAATLAVAFVLILLGYGKVDGWTAVLLVFVLALFAISPAMLLINERPPRGIDKWMPGAADDDTKPDTPATDKTTKETASQGA